MTDPLWETADRVGLALRETSKMVNFLRAFDTDAPGDLAQRISHFTAVFSPLRIHPVLLGVRMNGMEQTGSVIQSPSDQQWLSDAVDCGTAFQVFVEFLRSRLPGYPVLRVPHLRDGSPHVMNNPFTFEGFPWDPEIRGLRLQLRPAPDTSPLGGPDHGSLLGTLSLALSQHPAWAEYAAARRSLDAADRTVLSEIASRFAASVTEARVDEGAGERVLAAHQFRLATLEAACDAATGNPGRYLAAFSAVNELINIVAAYMDTVLMRGGVSGAQPSRAAFQGSGLVRDAAITIAGDIPMHSPGEVLFVDGPLPGATGVLYPTVVSHKWGQLNDSATSRMSLAGTLVSDLPLSE